MWRRSCALLAVLLPSALAATAPAPAPFLSASSKGALYKGLVTEIDFLLNNSATYWVEHGLDKVGGGFYGTLSRNGSNVAPETKGFTAEARYLWGFVTLYENGYVGRDEAELICKSLYDLLYQKFRDPTDDMYWMRVARNGDRLLGKQPGEEANVLYAGEKKWLYGQSFATLSMARYAIAFNRTDARDAAMANFMSWDKKFHDDVYKGYDQAKDDGLYIDFKGDVKPVGTPMAAVNKVTNVHLHLLSSLSELWLATRNETVADRLYELVTLFNTKVTQPQGYGNQYFTREWNPVGEFVVACGHDMETSELLLEAAENLQGTKYAENATRLAKETALNMTRIALKYCYDYQHGGWYNAVNMTNENPPHVQDMDQDHIWWVEAEALPTLFRLYQFTGDESLLRKLVGTLDWIKNNQRDQEWGEVYWGVWPDGAHDARGTNKGEFWKANYHLTHGLTKLKQQLVPAMSTASA